MKGLKRFEGMAAAAMDLMFPPACGACGRRLPAGDPDRLCPDCFESMHFLRDPLCPVCGMEQLGRPGSPGHLCGGCLARPPSFTLARSLVRYETAARQLVHRLKYGGDTMVVGALADLLRRCDLSAFGDCDVIVPVPLHRTRLRQRGLNQAVVLARLLFPHRLHRVRPEGLVRLKKTMPQTGLRGVERRRNLRHAFGLHRSFCPEGAVVCLVDDVFTTGTTVQECSAVLRRNGAKEVRVLTMARASLSGSSGL